MIHNVADLLLRAGAASDPALLHGSTMWTYGELRDHVRRCARKLAAVGSQKAEPVGILAENGVFFVESYLGTILHGNAAVPLQTETSPEALQRILREAGIRHIFVSRRQERRTKGTLEGTGVKILRESSELAATDQAVSDEVPDSGWGPNRQPETSADFLADSAGCGSELASLMYTSGSTGAPKGVMVTHGNIAANTRDIVQYLNLSAADRVMVVLPFFYCYGLSLLHSHLAIGASLVINNQFLYPEQVLCDMVEKSCTGLAGVPSTYQILLRKSRFKEMAFPALRWLQQAGGRLPSPYIQEIRKAFPGVNFFTMYGQTEATARLSYLPPKELSHKLGSIGKGLPSTRLAVWRSDGVSVTPGSDEVGEVVAWGGNITLGYWRDAEETARFFRNGRLHTGDLARVDGDGYIFIVEREREMIKSGGNRVGAKEVEEVLAELPEVVEAAVIGVPDDILGEAIVAFLALVPAAALTPEEVKDHCRRRLPSFKVPAEVRLLPQLPHNTNGKVVKRTLRASLEVEARACG